MTSRNPCPISINLRKLLGSALDNTIAEETVTFLSEVPCISVTGISTGSERECHQLCLENSGLQHNIG
jgi:hypothetical protein